MQVRAGVAASRVRFQGYWRACYGGVAFFGGMQKEPRIFRGSRFQPTSYRSAGLVSLLRLVTTTSYLAAGEEFDKRHYARRKQASR